ncbi:MAG: IS200/IS605 family transposase [Chloroflexota bacterium]|nr:IS200/IS605 family transposase [Chloroflexota bacterium]
MSGTRERQMSHTYTYLATHIIFSTKDRLPTITPDFKPKLWAYMNGIISNIGGKALAINGMADHTHLLVLLPPTVATAEALRALKANSSKWVHENYHEQSKFAWQNGYAAFSVSKSGIEEVVRYIENQKEHQRKFSYQDELLALLHKHGIEYDPRYIWS